MSASYAVIRSFEDSDLHIETVSKEAKLTLGVGTDDDSLTLTKDAVTVAKRLVLSEGFSIGPEPMPLGAAPFQVPGGVIGTAGLAPLRILSGEGPIELTLVDTSVTYYNADGSVPEKDVALTLPSVPVGFTKEVRVACAQDMGERRIWVRGEFASGLTGVEESKGSDSDSESDADKGVRGRNPRIQTLRDPLWRDRTPYAAVTLQREGDRIVVASNGVGAWILYNASQGTRLVRKDSTIKKRK